MRYIILKTEVVDGSLTLLGLTELSQKASGFASRWIDIKEAKADCSSPEKCDFLSFEEEDIAQQLLEDTGMVDEVNITYIGVDA
jgi:hypothetical protein